MLKRTITLGELVVAAVAVISCIVGFYISTNVRLSALEMKQESATANYVETNKNFDKINIKLDQLNQGQNEIKISLERKQDRK